MSLPKPYYADASVTLYHGDAREIMPLIHGDVMVTDPPYGMAYSSGWMARPIANDENTDTRDAILSMWDKPALVFGRWNCPRPAKTKMRLVWSKGDWPGMGDLAMPWGPSDEEIYVIGDGFAGKRGGTVIACDRLTGNTSHPNEKPLGLLVELLSKCPRGVIVDPFAGSGTTLRAAKDVGRRAIGIELDEGYCRIAVRRLRQEAFAFGA